MFKNPKARGFSLIEILLVLAILGIVAGIAIPSYMGQRRRARVIGDAMANAQTLRMMLEARKAENGIYGSNGVTYTWGFDGSVSDSSFLPSFSPKGNSRMNYSVVVNTSGLGYELTVSDPSIGSGVTAYKTNQTGEELERLK